MSDPQFEHIGDPVTCTIEECAELIHILCKVQRFGWKSCNPYDPKQVPNYVLVLNEMIDLGKRVIELREEMLRQVPEMGEKDAS